MSAFPVCPRCGKKTVRFPPERHDWFVDTLINCQHCDWCTVESEISPPPVVYQPTLFKFEALTTHAN